MKIQIKYIVRHPIYGYSGEGYSNRNILEKSFSTIEQARKYKRRADKCFEGHLYQSISFDEFYREMTDHMAFRFTGLGQIFKITTSEESVE